jgi:hypothetical protein
VSTNLAAIDPYTGKAWSPDAAHYRPVCAAH